MAKRPLLRDELGMPAAALLLVIMLLTGFFMRPAFAEGEGAQQAPRVFYGTPPAAGQNDGEPVRQPAAEQPKAEQPKDASSTDAPASAKTAGAGPDGEAAKQKDATAEAQPAEKAAGASASAPSAAPQEVSPPQAGFINPKDPEVKPAENNPAPRTPPEVKEATPGKPKDLTPNPEGGENLVVRASTVNAVYRIHWLGAHIGDFKIRSSITNRRYSLQANADVSVFFGAFAWQGVTSSYGMMTANGPVPQNYSFRYSTNDRREAIELRFQQRMVQDIIINPPFHPGARNVPVTAGDLQNVLDPLSAVVLLSQARLARSGNACDKRIPIFDGRIRYDLVLSPKGTRTVGGAGRLRGTAHVCRIGYVPIAGHKLGKQGADYATGNTGIEVWLVPVPEAGLLVTYYVHVPTPAGTASMVMAKFDLETPSGRHALAD
jgi:hypothetical protein